jgi:predicted methyltransferase MtxX (methanogen marker protein 4)
MMRIFQGRDFTKGMVRFEHKPAESVVIKEIIHGRQVAAVRGTTKSSATKPKKQRVRYVDV